jgi:Ca2+-binding RTX toxin-like protein
MYNVILWPREQGRYTSDKFIDLWKNGQIEIVKAFGPTDIPADPDWTEDPFESRIWSAYYQSMGWAYGGEAAFKAGEFDEFPTFIKELILDFAEDNSDRNSPTHLLTYHDGANAFRVSNIAYWYETYLKPGAGYGVDFTPDEEALFRNSLVIQRDELLYQLSQAQHWEGNNHRFFHSMALSSFATVFGSLDPSSALYEPDADIYLEQGLEVIQDIVNSLVFTSEGVTAEQSFTYHRLDLGLVLETIQSVTSHGYHLDIDFEGLLSKMFEFDLLSRRPGNDQYDLYVSEVGDTFFGGISGAYYINEVIEGNYQTPVTLWITSEGEEGERPGDMTVYDEAGYVIIRPEFAWENDRDLRVLVDATPSLHSHGHYDNSNVLLSMYGERILVDSGGPYSYDNINPFGYDFGYSDTLKEFYFEHSRAHNVVVVDGVSSDSDTLLLDTSDNEVFSAVRLEREFNYVLNTPAPPIPAGMTAESYEAYMRDTYDEILLGRDIVVLKNSGITFVFDDITNFGAGKHDYTLGWHFDPSAMGLSAGEMASFSQNGIFGDAAFAGSEGMEIEFFQGYAGQDFMQGWVTPGLYELQEAPVLELQVTDTSDKVWFASAFSASLSALPELQMDLRDTDNGGYAAYLSYDGFYDIVTRNQVGEILVQEYEGASVAGHETVVFAADQTSSSKVASSGNDWFIGTDFDDKLYGLDGDDLIVAGAGGDRIDGGLGDDATYGEDGDDAIYDFYGNNFVDDGDGDDRVRTGDGNDIVNNGAGDDLIATGGGDDLVRAGAGKDRYYAGDGYDTFLVNGAKDDFLFEMRDDHFLLWDRNAADGDLGRNYLYEVEHIAFAGSDDNIFIDDETVNDYRDSPGNDTFVLGGGNDRIYAGDGFDSVIIQGSSDQFYVEDRGTYTVVMDRFIDDGDLGRNYLYDVESIVFTDGLPFA